MNKNNTNNPNCLPVITSVSSLPAELTVSFLFSTSVNVGITIIAKKQPYTAATMSDRKLVKMVPQ